MKKILMCPPKYYNIEYVINPWMKTGTEIDRDAAYSNYNLLKESYELSGMEVLEIEPVEGSPDMIYTANLGYTEGNVFIKANFKAPERRKESEVAVNYFESLNYKIHTLPENILFEGEGDIIRSGTKYFIGYGERSSINAKEHLEKILNKELHALELNNPYFYHLDTCLGLLNDETAMINTAAFTKEGLELIESQFKNIIIADEKDNNLLACNLVVNKNDVFIGKGISEKLKRELESYGFKITEIDMTEFLKGGGSVKCLTQEIFD
ncbi:MAG TPA: hypothetical protein ENI57_08225 [Ignavibacteria bacterium]|nr:hypothetical protein [Ignavibacteria bacterium]